MMKTGKVALKIDAVRVYQSRDDEAHSGQPHSVGCDPPDFPTKEYIKGYEYRYMRNPPFVFEDKHPLRKIKNGGGVCEIDEHCGGGGVEDTEVDESWELPDETKKTKKLYEKNNGIKTDDEDDVLDLDDADADDKGGGGGSTFRENQSPLKHLKDKNKAGDAQVRPNRKLASVNDPDAKEPSEEGGDDKNETDDPTAGLEKPPISEESLEDNEVNTKVLSNKNRKPKGQCVTSTPGLFGMMPTSTGKQCKCNKGYTGPHCLSIDKYDDEPGAYEMKMKKMSFLFKNRASPYMTRFHIFLGGMLLGAFLVALVMDGVIKSRKDKRRMEMAPLRR
jgi:hypothetical protein